MKKILLAFLLFLLSTAGNAQIGGGIYGSSSGGGAVVGGSCTNQFVRSLDTSAIPTCASVANADLSGSIAASKLVGTDIATVGTVTTGVWNAKTTKRVVTLTDAATVTPNADTTDIGVLTTLSQSTTLANPSGTPVNGQSIIIRVKSTTARTWTFGSQYRGSTDAALPSATSGSSLTDYMGFMWNSADSKWDYIAKSFGF